MARLYETTFDDVFQCEFKFILFQVAKILNFWKLTQFKELFVKQIKQHSSICSYYIIKTLFLINCNRMFKYWEDNDFMMSERFIPIYESMFDDKNPFIVEIDKMLNYIQKHKEDKFIFKTMKMVAYQIH